MPTSCHLYLFFQLCVYSTQQQEMKVEGSPYHHLAPALRTSAQHRSSSVTGPKAHATTLQTSTASGSPLWTSHSTRIPQQRHWKQASSCHASAAARSAWRTYERLQSGVDTKGALHWQLGGGGSVYLHRTVTEIWRMTTISGDFIEMSHWR